MPLWLKDKLHMRRTIRHGLGGSTKARILFMDHHESHAASAFFPSPFEEAAILTLDGVGEWSTATYGTGAGNHIQLTHQIQFPHSLGLLYSAFTYYCGFKVNSGEYKLMGLAPYGRPIYQDLIYKHLIDLKPDGSFWLNMDYFNYCQGLTMTNQRFHRLFGAAPRQPETPIEQLHLDLAASIQAVTEEVMLRIGRHLHRQTAAREPGPGGRCGAQLRCQRPAATGGAVRRHLDSAGGGRCRWRARGRLVRLAPASGESASPSSSRRSERKSARATIQLRLRSSASWIRRSVSYQRFPDEADLYDHTASLLAEEKVVGWFQGRMEFGPRALGARSILGDPRSPRMQANMNVKIKFRESFRPFAPCVLLEHAPEWFDIQPGQESPYMLLVAPVLESQRLEYLPFTTKATGCRTIFSRMARSGSTSPMTTAICTSPNWMPPAGGNPMSYERFLAKKGDVFFWTADLVHRSHPRTLPEGTSRLSCVTHYHPATTTPFWFRHHPERTCVINVDDRGAYVSIHHTLAPKQQGMIDPDSPFMG